MNEEGELVGTGEFLVDNYRARDHYFYRVLYKNLHPGYTECFHETPLLKEQVVVEVPGPVRLQKLHVAASGRVKVMVMVDKDRFNVPVDGVQSVFTTFLDCGGQEVWGFRTEKDENLYVVFQNLDSVGLDVYVSGVVQHLDLEEDGYEICG